MSPLIYGSAVSTATAATSDYIMPIVAVAVGIVALAAVLLTVARRKAKQGQVEVPRKEEPVVAPKAAKESEASVVDASDYDDADDEPIVGKHSK